MNDPLPTAEQKQALCELMHEAFLELRYLEGKQAQDLAYAFHNLPKTMYGWGAWSIAGMRQALQHYQNLHEKNLGVNYVNLFNAIYPVSI